MPSRSRRFPASSSACVVGTDVYRRPLGDDPLFEAGAVGRSADGRTAAEHDDVLCSKRRRVPHAHSLRLGVSAAERWLRQSDGSQHVRWERIDRYRCERGIELFLRDSDKS
jgi:hypothetical protein